MISSTDLLLALKFHCTLVEIPSPQLSRVAKSGHQCLQNLAALSETCELLQSSGRMEFRISRSPIAGRGRLEKGNKMVRSLSIDSFIHVLVGRPLGRSLGRSVGRSVGWLAGWLVDSSVRFSVHWYSLNIGVRKAEYIIE